jgi:hypothetical protein
LEEASVFHLRNQKKGLQAHNSVCSLLSVPHSGCPSRHPDSNVFHSLLRASDPAREPLPHDVHFLWGFRKNHQGWRRSPGGRRERASTDVGSSSDRSRLGIASAFPYGNSKTADLRFTLKTVPTCFTSLSPCSPKATSRRGQRPHNRKVRGLNRSPGHQPTRTPGFSPIDLDGLAAMAHRSCSVGRIRISLIATCRGRVIMKAIASAMSPASIRCPNWLRMDSSISGRL